MDSFPHPSESALETNNLIRNIVDEFVFDHRISHHHRKPPSKSLQTPCPFGRTTPPALLRPSLFEFGFSGPNHTLDFLPSVAVDILDRAERWHCKLGFSKSVGPFAML